MRKGTEGDGRKGVSKFGRAPAWEGKLTHRKGVVVLLPMTISSNLEKIRKAQDCLNHRPTRTDSVD